MQFKNLIKLSVAMVLSGILAGCGGNSIEVSANFSNSQGIKEDTPVYL